MTSRPAVLGGGGGTAPPPSRPQQQAAHAHDREVDNDRFLDLLMSASPTTEVVLVLVGIPGCGKSTFARQIVESSPDAAWCVACQDVEGDRKKVERLVVEVLEGRSTRCAGIGRVIVDRCNFDRQQRKHWIDISLARQASSACARLLKLCVVLPKPDDVEYCAERALARGDDGVHSVEEDWGLIVRRMGAQYEAPKRTEGFDSIFWCSSQEELDLLGSLFASLPTP